MFGGIVATRENAWAPSSGVLPSGVPMGDDIPNEGFGDSNEHSNENEGIPPMRYHQTLLMKLLIKESKHLGLYTVMDEFNNMYNNFDMNYDTSELIEKLNEE
ncbi:hypothetical protein J1N35_025585 [Gossypium stocksii]|uniref:Uncharacterized protein n=1 Tax=Gossypium stocksii TaxID=47602 RepID=A0A9D3V6M7_9ROSI|nr:hypothetical protein J1N35_025585 [Gossypium stocksii]